MAVQITIPEAGESISEVQVGQWYKSEGDWVEQDEAVVEVESDKASMDLPAPAAGVLTKIMIQTGEMVEVGQAVAEIDETAQRPAGAEAKAKDAAPAAEANAAPQPAGQSGETRVMPAARRELAQNQLDAKDVPASGPGGRLLKEDVQRHVASGGAAQPAAAPSAPAGERQEEVVPMSLLRRRVAERLVEAQQNAALLTTFNEIDMSTVMQTRRQNQDAFQKRYGIKLGIMSFFVKATIEALKEFPQLNAEIRGNDIVYRNYFDIGVAVSTERGLMVPVIRNAERYSFAELERLIADFAERARDKKIAPEELQGGTFTISNGGVFGSLMSTPIVNPPQSGILGLHTMQERPVARDGQVVIRPMMYVALTYDHRIVDGRESVGFLKRIKECVEQPARILIES